MFKQFGYLKKPILQKAKKDIFYCITEIYYNLIKGNIPLDTVTQQAWLKKNFALITLLSKKKVAVSRKRKYLLRTKTEFLAKLFELALNHAEETPSDPGR